MAYTDGASRGNPGPAAYGVVIINPAGEVEAAFGVPLGRNTNQVAEYEGLIRALEELKTRGARRARILTDSQFVVRQFSGEYRAKDERMKALLARARGLGRSFASLRVDHIARSGHPFNTQADALANEALDRGRRKR